MTVCLYHSRATGTAKVILLGIANHAGDGGAYPTKETLARYANLNGKTAGKLVQKHLQTLRSLGEIRVRVQEGGDRDCPEHLRPNRYDILVSCPPWCDRSLNHRDTRRTRQTALLNPVDNTGVGLDPGCDDVPGPGMQTDPQTGHTTGDTQGAASPTGHARPEGPACHVCSQVERRCQALQSKWLPDHRHPFTPRSKP